MNAQDLVLAAVLLASGGWFFAHKCAEVRAF
jgi:hypothetical protein